MTTTIEQLKDEVAEKINAIEYNWTDVDTNTRIVEDIRTAIDNLPEVPSAMHIAEVAVSANDYIQIRDFLMGVGYTEKPKDKVTTYLALLNDILDEHNAVPTITVLSSYMYEMDNKELAESYLEKALEIDPDYSLANLLRRVYDQEWPAETFTNMGKQLHKEVLKTIYQGFTRED